MHIEYRWKDWANKVSMSTSGPILQADRPHRFFFQWGEKPSTIEFEFTPKDGGTYMTVRERSATEAEYDGVCIRMGRSAGVG